MVEQLRKPGVRIALVVVVNLLVALAVLPTPRDTANAQPEAQAVLTGETLKPRPVPRCRLNIKPFVPTTISVEGVTKGSPVLALQRDARGVPGVAPVSDKVSFAWDAPGSKPGDKLGNVHLNTHTWPDGTAMGNKLLRDLDVGDEIVLRNGKQRLCYEVTERLETPVEDAPVERIYDTESPSQIVLIVCSGVRRGPGDWANRTIWFAKPVRSVN